MQMRKRIKIKNKIKICLLFFETCCILSKCSGEYARNKFRWLIGQGVKTPPSHGGNRGSIPLLAARKTLGRCSRCLLSIA